MIPGQTGSPSTAGRAARAPARFRILGRTLEASVGKWITTKTAAGRSAGSPRTNSMTASTAPADPPITTISRPAIGATGSIAAHRAPPARGTGRAFRSVAEARSGPDLFASPPNYYLWQRAPVSPTLRRTKPRDSPPVTAALVPPVLPARPAPA